MPRYQGYGAYGSGQRGYGRSRYEDEPTHEGRQSWRRDEHEDRSQNYGSQRRYGRGGYGEGYRSSDYGGWKDEDRDYQEGYRQPSYGQQDQDPAGYGRRGYGSQEGWGRRGYGGQQDYGRGHGQDEGRYGRSRGHGEGRYGSQRDWEGRPGWREESGDYGQGWEGRGNGGRGYEGQGRGRYSEGGYGREGYSRHAQGGYRPGRHGYGGEYGSEYGDDYGGEYGAEFGDYSQRRDRGRYED
jgi:hypothetical protein